MLFSATASKTKPYSRPSFTTPSLQILPPSSPKRLPFERRRNPGDRLGDRSSQRGFPLVEGQGSVRREGSVQVSLRSPVSKESQGESKYVSPHFVRSSCLVSPPQRESERFQKFSRKRTTVGDYDRQRQGRKEEVESPRYRKIEGLPIEISIESALTKGSDLEEIQGQATTWLLLEAENQQLKREKAALEAETAFLKHLLRQAQVPIPSFPNKQSRTCLSAAQLGLQSRLWENSKKPQRRGQERGRQMKHRLSNEEQTIAMLRDEISVLTMKYQALRESNQELLELIGALKKQHKQERNAFESIAVRQDILMRRKGEFESAKFIASKADQERASLKKTLGEYRQKMNQLSEMLSKSKKPKLDESLDLSLELSTSFDHF